MMKKVVEEYQPLPIYFQHKMVTLAVTLALASLAVALVTQEESHEWSRPVQGGGPGPGPEPGTSSQVKQLSSILFSCHQPL